MSAPFLILHKVRGEPAFDVAERCEIDHEEAWIVSTSGHRAYPYHSWNLEDLVDTSDINENGFHDHPAQRAIGPEFVELRDHYTVRAAPEDKSTIVRRATGLLQVLGLAKTVKADRRG